MSVRCHRTNRLCLRTLSDPRERVRVWPARGSDHLLTSVVLSFLCHISGILASQSAAFYGGWRKLLSLPVVTIGAAALTDPGNFCQPVACGFQTLPRCLE